MEKKITIICNNSTKTELIEALSHEEAAVEQFIRALCFTDSYVLRHLIDSLDRKLGVSIFVENRENSISDEVKNQFAPTVNKYGR